MGVAGVGSLETVLHSSGGLEIHEDYGLSELDAYELLSKVAKIHLNEMVDPNYVVVALIEKKYLPPKRK